MTRSFKTLWARFLFRDKGILPTPRLLLGLLAVSIVLIAAGAIGLSWLWIVAVDGAYILASLVDLLSSPKKKQLWMERMIDEELERGLSVEGKIKVGNRSDKGAVFKLVDDFPESFERPFPLKGIIDPHSEQVTSFTFKAHHRGDYSLEGIYIRYRSKFGLWEKQMKAGLQDHIRVLPDMTESRQYLLDAQQFLLYEGVKQKKRKLGSGEFSKIRSYVVGDDLRKINWRQTAKLQELMTNEYEPEHGKYVTILIDCGRMMGVELDKGNRLERSLEAALAVATAALKNGDYVSLLAFSKEVKAFVPPAKGMAHFQTIIKEMYNLQVDDYESNYGAVFHYLQTMQKKRSFLLLFTDVNSFIYEDSPLFYLQRISKKHVFLMIGVLDEVTSSLTKEEPDTVEKAMVKSMAERHILLKKREMAKWERQGLQWVEAPEEQLAASSVSLYVQMLNRGLI
ncbi:DUF58 domain-containing protein [Halobacillus salinarum]|uniref:DUF58 domain-containing protein n=1 Tax=Halobacillus salinarum TaxID=2932257 RepID=A0ABY4EN41_9BACI|nr:DUF58 domain-containing protein [Halobacillus salinarum]UOQ45032.1 DUF58 domain-containing protein [Halobacillus salinarum]